MVFLNTVILNVSDGIFWWEVIQKIQIVFDVNSCIINDKTIFDCNNLMTHIDKNDLSWVVVNL